MIVRPLPPYSPILRPRACSSISCVVFKPRPHQQPERLPGLAHSGRFEPALCGAASPLAAAPICLGTKASLAENVTVSERSRSCMRGTACIQTPVLAKLCPARSFSANDRAVLPKLYCLLLVTNSMRIVLHT